jgi:hypothetical protein
MILRFEFTIGVYIVFFVSCQKRVFDNLALDPLFLIIVVLSHYKDRVNPILERLWVKC